MKGALAFAELLESNSVLRRLNIRRNGVTTGGAKHLLAALDCNSTLTELRIGRKINRTIRKQIKKRLQENSATQPTWRFA